MSSSDCNRIKMALICLSSISILTWASSSLGNAKSAALRSGLSTCNINDDEMVFTYAFWSTLKLCHMYIFCYVNLLNWSVAGFFGGMGVPHPAKIQSPPHPTLVPIFGPRLVSPPAEVRPGKFEKFKYIFVSNLTTFKLKSTLKSCISCLK